MNKPLEITVFWMHITYHYIRNVVECLLDVLLTILLLGMKVSLIPMTLLRVVYKPFVAVLDYYGKRRKCRIFNHDGSEEHVYKRTK